MVKWWIELGFYEGEIDEKEPFPAGISLVDVIENDEVADALRFVLDVVFSSPFASKLRKLQRSTGISFIPTNDGSLELQKLKRRKFTRQEALEALELAIEYALWAEQVYG